MQSRSSDWRSVTNQRLSFPRTDAWTEEDDEYR